MSAYDNTVWYSNVVLNELFEVVRAKHPISWLFYSAVHGEHVTGKGGAFHGDFNDELIHNSFLVFPPYAY